MKRLAQRIADAKARLSAPAPMATPLNSSQALPIAPHYAKPIGAPTVAPAAPISPAAERRTMTQDIAKKVRRQHEQAMEAKIRSQRRPTKKPPPKQKKPNPAEVDPTFGDRFAKIPNWGKALGIGVAGMGLGAGGMGLLSNNQREY